MARLDQIERAKKVNALWRHMVKSLIAGDIGFEKDQPIFYRMSYLRDLFIAAANDLTPVERRDSELWGIAGNTDGLTDKEREIFLLTYYEIQPL